MGSRKLRVTILFALLVGSIGLTGLLAPGASAEPGDLIVQVVNQPTDTGADDLITASTFDPTGGDAGFVQVLVTQEQFEGPPLAVAGAEVSFELASGAGLATGTLNVTSRFTNTDGIATFAPEEGSDNPLSIADENQPFTTDYRLIPEAVAPSVDLTISSLEGGTQGAPSDPFDVWGDGCKGNGCHVNLTPGTSSLDTYTTSENVGMGASQLGLGGTNFSCPGQQLIFSTSLFFHATTGNGPVFLETHISEADRKAAANNGNKFMGWCLGLKFPGPWNFAQQNTNGIPGLQADDLYVGMAPKCPKKDAMNFAPCTLSIMGDGFGGTFIRGWVPGGDPPRRT